MDFIDRNLFFRDIPGNARRALLALMIFAIALFSAGIATLGIGVTAKQAVVYFHTEPFTKHLFVKKYHI